jgi:flagellar biosynthesis protein FlhG
VEPDLDASRAGRSFLRRWFRRAADPEPVLREGVAVAFASGKGGTGKSFLATNAAIALHRQGRRVVLVDCDFGLANAHLLLGVAPQRTLQHLFDGGTEPEDLLTPTPFGPCLVAGGSGIASLAELDVRHMHLLGAALQRFANACDVLLLDCAAGLSPQALVTVLGAQHVVLVTNPEIAALTDAYALIKCLARQPDPPAVHLAVNRVTQPGLGRAVFERLGQVSRRFVGCELHYLGELPEDPAVTQRRLGQPPLSVSHPTCPISLSIAAMLAELAPQADGLVARPGPRPRLASKWAELLRRW